MVQCMNKKGIVTEGITIILVLFVVAITMVVANELQVKFNQKTSDRFDSDASQLALQKIDETMRNFDYLFIFLVVGLLGVTIVSGFFIRTHPIFFIVSILGLFISVVLAALFSNIFYDVSMSDNLANSTDVFTVMPHVMNNLPTYVLIMIAITIAVLYGKWRFTQPP